MKYTTPVITSYSDAEINELTAAALYSCHGGHFSCENGYMICSQHTGECTPAQYCSKSFTICKFYYKP